MNLPNSKALDFFYPKVNYRKLWQISFLVYRQKCKMKMLLQKGGLRTFAFNICIQTQTNTFEHLLWILTIWKQSRLFSRSEEDCCDEDAFESKTRWTGRNDVPWKFFRHFTKKRFCFLNSKGYLLILAFWVVTWEIIPWIITLHVP